MLVAVSVGFRLLLVPSPGLYGFRLPADIVGVWSMAALVLVFCAWQRISSGGWLSAVLGRVFPALRVPLVSVSVCCRLSVSYAWGAMWSRVLVESFRNLEL